jgi:hypothetical protein
MEIDFIHLKSTIRNHLFLILFFIIGIWELPLLIRYPDISLDSSWNLGMNMAFLNSMQFGKDIVFTYGLLGVLENPVLNNYSLWKMSVIFIIFVQFLFIIALYLLLRSLSARWYHYLMFIPFFLLVLPILRPHWGLLLSLSIFLYLILTSKKRSPVIYGGLTGTGLLLALVSLLKFDMLLNSLFLIAFFSILGFLTKRDRAEGVVLASSYVCSFAGIWYMTGQQLQNIPSYLIGGWEIAKGYTAAMSTTESFWLVLPGLAILVFIGIIFLFFFLSGQREFLLFLALDLFILFSAFKSVFVRLDSGHIIEGAWIFVFFFFVILVALDIMHKNRRFGIFVPVSIIVSVIFIILLSLVLLHVAPWILHDSFSTHFDTSVRASQLLTSETVFDETVNIQKEKLVHDYNITPEIIRFLDNKSTSVIPWDVNVAWAYGLTWSPLPVFQTYSAYTRYLDDINRASLQGNTAPAALLYSYKSIDGRYPIFDEPSTFTAILNNYAYVNSSGEFILLKHTMDTIDRREIPLGGKTCNLGEPVSVPEYPGEIFGAIHIRYSPVGALLTTLYKPEPLYIRFMVKNGMVSERYRFIPDNAENGIFLSEFVGDSDTFSSIMEGNLINNIGSIIIETDHPEYYAESFTVDFTGIPHTLQDGDNLLITHPMTFKTVVFQEAHPSYSFKKINGDEKIAFFEHAMDGGSAIEINNVSIGNISVLRFATAMDPEIWSPDKGDGVEYRVHVLSAQGDDLVFSRYLDPKNNPGERKWNEYSVDLSDYSGQNVTLVFSTLPGPGNDPAWDWAWWGDPVILRNISGTPESTVFS